MGNAQFRDTPGCAPRCGPAKKPHQNSILATPEEETKEEKPRNYRVLNSIKTTLKDIFDPPEPQRLPPKRRAPKQLLHGCSCADEHFECIEQTCEKIANLQGLEGIRAMGFDYRVVHHSKNCQCVGLERVNNNDDDLTDSEADDDQEEGYLESSEEGDDDEYGQFDDGSDDEEEKESEVFMVPVGSPLKIPEEPQELGTISSPYNYPSASLTSSSVMSSSAVSRNTSALSLFSLATHNTDFSNPTTNTNSTPSRTRRPKSARFPLASISGKPNELVAMEQDSCALRLHHTETGTMITPENHTTYMADGTFYDELARLCMEYAQQVMMEEANLEWVTVSEEDNYGAIATKNYLENRRRKQPGNGTKRKTLLVVTGKGQVQAGIFSRRHLLVTSMEAATALPFTRGAEERDMDIVMIDPNALGYRNGMDVVERSLEHFFVGDDVDEEEEIYVVAHSMAGAQIVRFFIANSSCNSRPASSTTSTSVSEATSNGSKSNGTAASNGDAIVDKTALRCQLLKRIKAFAFTDSNHNMNWVKNHSDLTHALTGPPSLYIKSHKVHEKAKELGEAHHDCQFWRHRFGDIKTLWAGTHEHALTNYTARAHIWDHFDQFLNPPKDEQPQQQQLPPRCLTS